MNENILENCHLQLEPHSHEHSIFCSCAISVFRHVGFGHPGFLLLGCIHLRTTLGMLFLSILRMCPNHHNCRCLFSMTALLQLVSLRSSTFDILLGQNIQQNFLEHRLWKASIFAMSPLTTGQHSEPYSKIDFT